MKKMYAITHINKDGMRQLTFANQGRNHYDTKDAAQKALELFKESLKGVIGDAVSTLRVWEIECYDHGDATGIYVKDENDPFSVEMRKKGIKL